jgi:hypothetical protein
MTAEQFRRLALSLPEAVELAHMGHPDFRVGGKIFATLGYPRAGWAMIKLPPEDAAFLVRTHPDTFSPVKGAWGRAGCTNLELRVARAGPVREALTIAWQARAAKRPPR